MRFRTYVGLKNPIEASQHFKLKFLILEGWLILRTTEVAKFKKFERFSLELNPQVLVVAEKDSVAKAFAEALAEGRYKVLSIGKVKLYGFEREDRKWVSIGLKGHLFNLDFEEGYNRWKYVEPRELFYIKPIWRVAEGSHPYLEALREVGRNVELIYLALDGDSEGEAIAFEALSEVRRVNPYVEFRRPWFSTLNRNELLEAVEKGGRPNQSLADKCFARMEIDLTIGASFTRMLTLSVERASSRSLPLGRFLSYGPCQSPVLYLVVKRAMEREAFIPEKFWRILASLRIGDIVLTAEHVKGRFSEEDEVKALLRKLEKVAEGVVEEYVEETTFKHPPIPLNTVELEARASRFLNLRPQVALNLAEELYRRGYISYPRTETEVYSPLIDLKSMVTSFRNHPIYRSFSERLLKSPLKSTRGSRDDKAHPPIHPVKSATKEEVVSQLGFNAWRLYDLVVRHFLATLSPSARLVKQKAVVEMDGERFSLKGLKVEETGYMEVYHYERPLEKTLPLLKVKDIVRVLKLEVEEAQTEPPPFLSEAELLKTMEKLHIGTDATASQHIQTNIDRGYFYIEGRRCIPTPLGMALIKSFMNLKPELVEPKVRSLIESLIAEVALKNKAKEEVVEHAKKIFLSYYDEVKLKEAEIARALIPTLEESFKIALEKSRKRRFRVK